VSTVSCKKRGKALNRSGFGVSDSAELVEVSVERSQRKAQEQ
jgi:hypothetical protein